MAEQTGISWADHTFNPWIGCTKVSPGCDHCYAETLATRRLGVQWGPHALRRRTAASTWKQPLIWDRKAERDGVRRRVFCASLADVFDNQVAPDWRAELFDLIRVTTHLDWLLLTKRPQNIGRMLPEDWRSGWTNVWLGTSAENQTELERRAPQLRAIPAALRFLSCEPLLSALELLPWLGPGGFGWVIAGGESGRCARPAQPDWARSLRDQCAQAAVPFHFKQWGAQAPGHLLDAREHLEIPHA